MALKGLVARGMEGVTGSAARGEPRGDAAHGQTEGAAHPTTTRAAGLRSVAPSTSVDASSELEGRLRCSETLRIDGRILGEIECEKAVIIGQGARVHASIDADDVQVAGIVEGDIRARRKVTLERTAVVVGDLTTPGIVIEEGAKLKGRILIGSDAEAEDLVAQAKASEKDDAKTERVDASAERPEAENPARDRKRSAEPAKGRAVASKSEPAAATPA